MEPLESEERGQRHVGPWEEDRQDVIADLRVASHDPAADGAIGPQGGAEDIGGTDVPLGEQRAELQPSILILAMELEEREVCINPLPREQLILSGIAPENRAP